ncbi:MAG: hypothetical protein Q7U52_11780 [Hydrogenophaga sp.]|nr:hypothetical protein [Hydrogenophaga sp.]
MSLTPTPPPQHKAGATFTRLFPVPGTYQITGNLGADIVPVAGVYVERKTSAAFATMAVGSGGLPPDQVALLQAIAQQLDRVKNETGLIPALL